MSAQHWKMEVCMSPPRGWELIIVLIIIILLFGPGRLSKIAGEIGRGIREFRKGMETEDSPDTASLEEPSDEE
jgi:sec-independent protein translocase protein TatA